MTEQISNEPGADFTVPAQNLLPINGTSAQTPAAVLPATGIAQIIKAIAGVMHETDTVAKRGQNTFHQYKYARMEDVLQTVTPLLAKHGLIIVQTEVARAMFDDERAVAVQYQFTIAHSSGEIWPERPLQSGLSRCRDSKGGFDDKALNKCHTAARKYFLLSLFQIPTGEEPESDQGDNDAPRTEQPQPIRVNKGGAKAWTTQFLTRIRQAPSLAAIDQWVGQNRSNLDRLAAVAPEQARIANDAVSRRRTELTPNSKSLPPLVGSRIDARERTQ
jgi:hypothetical protein